MTGRSILDGLNTASKAGVKATPSARFRTKEIDIDNIYRNELNQYSLDDVDNLARAMTQTRTHRGTTGWYLVSAVSWPSTNWWTRATRSIKPSPVK